MHLVKIAVVAASTYLATGAARACEIDPFLFQLPGETEADAQERSDQIAADHETVRHYNRQRSGFENATAIYLARVESYRPGNFTSGPAVLPSTQVRPLFSLKGSLPAEQRTLSGLGAGGTCSDVGDGFGAFEKVGSLVVVFEGMPSTPERPRGTDSFQAKAIRIIPLLDELRKHGKDLEE